MELCIKLQNNTGNDLTENHLRIHILLLADVLGTFIKTTTKAFKSIPVYTYI